jgi:hypothetical protein
LRGGSYWDNHYIDLILRCAYRKFTGPDAR